MLLLSYWLQRTGTSRAARCATAVSRASLTCGAEVEEQRQLSAAGQSCVGLSQLVEEGVRAGLEGREPGGRGVLQQPGAQRDGFWRSAGLEHLDQSHRSEVRSSSQDDSSWLSAANIEAMGNWFHQKHLLHRP